MALLCHLRQQALGSMVSSNSRVDKYSYAPEILALSANLLPLAVYHNQELYEDKLHKISLQILSTWGWYMFVMHTLLTGSIIWKIIHVHRPAKNLFGCIFSRVPYAEVLRAIIESSFITWIGLLMYEITSFAPAGRITTDLNVGYVMGCILPVFFVRIASSDRANGSAECIRAVLASHLQGLAQCLITARVAYTESVKQNQPPEASFPLTPQSSIRASTLAINVKKEVHQWTDTLKTGKESMGRDVMHSPSFESGAC
ncbi:hypothetical protein EIP86_004292 [Pleurotus ostreatoroseus]|nr:hypothetical protein EIP86_004292 [Pleurotus ostreatoroseus]